MTPTITPEQLDAERTELLAAVVRAGGAARDAQERATGLVAARDALIRQALKEGIAPALLSRALGLSRGVIWRVEQSKTNTDLRRERMTA